MSLPEPARLAALLARCALRDQQAFAELYRLTAAKLYGVIVRISRRSDWAEEIMQEVYVSVWRHAHEYAPERSAPLTWIVSIARNRALDWLRRPQIESTGEDFESIVEAYEDAGRGPLEELEAMTQARALADCLAALDATQRQAIVLAFSRGLTHGELAAHMQAPLGSVKTWIRRGLGRLRRCLAGET